MSRKSLKYYSHILAALPVIALLCIAVLNYVVDPYRMFSSDSSALYKNYPALHPNLRLHKAYQVNRLKPDTIILGTSKAIQGIPLTHTYFDNKSVYNLAAPLAGMREIYHLFNHAQANKPLKEIVFVMDFLSFNVLARADGPAAGYVEARLKTPDNSNTYWPDYLAAMVSADALKASVNVLRTVANPTHRVLNGLGGREDEEIASRLTDGGHRDNSQKIESFFIESVLLAAPHRRFAMSDEHDNSLAWFEKFVTEVQALNIRTTLLIAPSHTRYWELLNQAGLWPQYESWKEQLVLINNKVAASMSAEPLTLLDFSLPNEITSESFPLSGDSDTKMKYYYESIHFNQYTGGLLLDSLIEYRSQPTTNTKGFGVPLTEQSLPTINNRIIDGLDKLRREEPALADELQKALPSKLKGLNES